MIKREQFNDQLGYQFRLRFDNRIYNQLRYNLQNRIKRRFGYKFESSLDNLFVTDPLNEEICYRIRNMNFKSQKGIV